MLLRSFSLGPLVPQQLNYELTIISFTRDSRTAKITGLGVWVTVEGGELGRWCELGQNFSDSSPLLLLVKGH